MTQIIKIPGRIESAATGNVVTGAKSILDDGKGKKQNVINSEVDAELVRLDQDKQNNLTFDNAPTEDSDNPVKSGGVYAADKAMSDAIEAILLLIPSAASVLNQLADKNFVNSSISTATAMPRGTYNLVNDLNLTTDATRDAIAEKLGEVIDVADLNDYAFVQVPVSDDDPTEIERTERYKFNGNVWIYEYTLNTSGFTAAQWEAINSGITDALVAKLDGLPTAAALELALGTITQNIQNIGALIPSEATEENQLADKAYVFAQILAATPSFKGQFTTLAQLQDVTGAKAGDLGIVRTKDSAGHDVFTFYQYLNNQWNEYYVMSYHPQDKPATTGWLGDYPYNGMGRIELPMNMVDGWPDNTWIYLPKNDVVYLLYSWRLQLYAVYNLDTQEGLGLDDNLVIKPENYDIADLDEIVNGYYLPFTEDGGVWTITKPDGSTITSTELNNTNIYHYNDPSHHGMNVLTQEMLNRTNTNYIIQYDYDLNGQTITVPENCILEFDGGSLSNGSIVGTNTWIFGTTKCFDNVLFSGYVMNDFVLGWFKIAQNAVDSASATHKAIHVVGNTYIDEPMVVGNDFSIYGDSEYTSCLYLSGNAQSPVKSIIILNDSSSLNRITIKDLAFKSTDYGIYRDATTDLATGTSMQAFDLQNLYFSEINISPIRYKGRGFGCGLINNIYCTSTNLQNKSDKPFIDIECYWCNRLLISNSMFIGKNNGVLKIVADEVINTGVDNCWNEQIYMTTSEYVYSISSKRLYDFRLTNSYFERTYTISDEADVDSKIIDFQCTDSTRVFRGMYIKGNSFNTPVPILANFGGLGTHTNICFNNNGTRWLRDPLIPILYDPTLNFEINAWGCTVDITNNDTTPFITFDTTHQVTFRGTIISEAVDKSLLTPLQTDVNNLKSRSYNKHFLVGNIAAGGNHTLDLETADKTPWLIDLVVTEYVIETPDTYSVIKGFINVVGDLSNQKYVEVVSEGNMLQVEKGAANNSIKITNISERNVRVRVTAVFYYNV